MENQAKQPGKMLRQLREKLGYQLEDWAAIFDTTPTIIASIELGHEMSEEFLVALIAWMIQTVEHPQKDTYILPQDWQKNLPETVDKFLVTLSLSGKLPDDLKSTYEIQKRALHNANEENRNYQKKIENYLQILAQQEEYLDEQQEQIEQQEEQILKQEQQITDLKKGKIIDKQIIRFQGFSKVLQGVLLFLVGGFLFTFIPQWLPEQSTSMEAFSLEGMTAQRDLPIPPTEKIKKAKSPSSSLSKSFLVAKRSKPLAHQVKPQQKVVENKNKHELNNDLFNLLAVNSERTMPVPQKYISKKGKTFLKFENMSKTTVIIAICDDKQQEIRRDTVKNTLFFLDVNAYTPGKYYYRMFTPSQRTEKKIGSFIIENKK